MAYIEASGGKVEQIKTAFPQTYVTNVLPDTGKVLSKVVVNPQEHYGTFNIFKYSWSKASDLPYSFNGSAVVYNNEIHILGGSGIYTYHYKWDGSSWTSVSTLPYNFTSNGSAVVLNGEIHILGGSYANYTMVYHYKWNGSSWSKISTLPYSFYNGSAVVLNGEIHILGGTGNTTKHYKWNGSSWTSVSTLPYNFYNGSAVVLNNEIHILGSTDGLRRHYVFRSSNEGTSYDWTSSDSLDYDFNNGSAVVYSNRIHILGGTQGTLKHYKYNDSRAKWSSVSTLPFSFYGGEAVVFNNEIHILGGSGSSSKHYKISGKSSNIDMGLNHSYRYVDDDVNPTKVLLYENPNPTSAQAAGGLALNAPANNFNWLLIKFADWTSGQGTQVRYSLWPDPTMYKESSSGGQYSFIAVGGYRGSSYGHARRLYFSKANTDWMMMYVTTGQQMNRAGTSDNGCRILAIYGVNNLSTDWLTA